MSGRPTAVERARTSTRKGSSGANTRYVYCSRAGSALPNALFTVRSYSTSRQFIVDRRDIEGGLVYLQRTHSGASGLGSQSFGGSFFCSAGLVGSATGFEGSGSGFAGSGSTFGGGAGAAGGGGAVSGLGASTVGSGFGGSA